jgi:hypothetical protein
MKRLVAVLELLWAAGNVVLALFFIPNAFTAKTVIKEGLPAQAVLLLLGLLMVVFAVMLALECVKVLRRPNVVET